MLRHLAPASEAHRPAVPLLFDGEADPDGSRAPFGGRGD
jgi:hypothetical protein